MRLEATIWPYRLLSTIIPVNREKFINEPISCVHSLFWLFCATPKVPFRFKRIRNRRLFEGKPFHSLKVPLRKQSDWWVYDFRACTKLADTIIFFLSACTRSNWTGQHTLTVIVENMVVLCGQMDILVAQKTAMPKPWQSQYRLHLYPPIQKHCTTPWGMFLVRFIPVWYVSRWLWHRA